MGQRFWKKKKARDEMGCDCYVATYPESTTVTEWLMSSAVIRAGVDFYQHLHLP